MTPLFLKKTFSLHLSDYVMFMYDICVVNLYKPHLISVSIVV